MRGYVVLIILGFIATICRGTSDPKLKSFSGSGSGSDDETSTVIITPSTTNKPSMDSTDGSGSGVDDEDDLDVESGSAASSTPPEASTKQTTVATTQGESTTEELTTQATTTRKTTTAKASTSGSATGPVTDDEDQFSGSGSGVVEIITGKPADESTTSSTSTDIYINETTTDDGVLILTRNDVKTTEKPSTKPPIVFKTTEKIGSTMQPSSSEDPTAKATTAPTKAAETTMKLLPKTTSRPDTTTKKPAEKTTEEFDTTTKLDLNTIKIETEISTEQYQTDPPYKVPEGTTKRNMGKTTSSEGDIMAQKKPPQEGFTLTAEVIAGVVGCAVLALLLIAFLMYRLKKRDEGSYLLDESNGYPDEYKKAHVSDKEAFI